MGRLHRFALMVLLAAGRSSLASAQDADADGVPDATESALGDSDGDGTPDTLDPDDDGDTRPTRVEEDGSLRDRDRDGVPDYLDADEDDDGLTLLAEDIDGDRRLTEHDDSDGDGLIDALDADDDGDGLETRFELGPHGASGPLDSDGDGRPDHLDADDDGDGWPTLAERALEPEADANRNGIVAYLDPHERGPRYVAEDLDRDGILDALDLDVDGDGVPNADERAGDSDGDGSVDTRDPDDDGDGVETTREGSRDSDGDQTPDYLDDDDDQDGILTRDELPDLDGDGRADDPRMTAFVPDYLTADDDNDGVSTARERPGNQDRDTDADGIPDHRDGDDDGDGVGTNMEAADGIQRDLDADGVFDWLDADDDGDGLLTRVECTRVLDQDVDADGLWNCRDLDSDADGVADAVEALLDTDDDGVPDYLDANATLKDSDDDGVADVRECEIPLLGCPDVDGDGRADAFDDDDDGDGLPTRAELAQQELDSDGDLTPNYLDTDDDGDGVPTLAELDAAGAARDMDKDGIMDHLDVDDDGDGVPTRAEAGDADGDGLSDFLDPLQAGPADAGAPAEAGIVQSGDSGLVLPSRSRPDDAGCALGARSSGAAAWSAAWLLLLALTRRRVWLLVMLAAGCADGENARGTIGLDASITFDGASPSDAGEARDGQPEGALPSCAAPSLRFFTGDTSARGFDAVSDRNVVQLAFIAPSCGGATSLGQGKGVRLLQFASAGPAGEPRQGEAEDCLPLREPTLADARTLFFGAQRDAAFDLYALQLDGSRAPVALNLAGELELSLSAAVLGTARSPALAYVAQPGSPDGGASPVRLWMDGTTRELLSTASGHHPSQVSLVRREEPMYQGQGFLGWRSDDPSTAGLYIRALDAQGAPTGDVVTVTREPGDLAWAISASASGVVYTEPLAGGALALRYRALEGGVLGQPRRLTAQGQDVRQHAVASYRDGFVVAYRNREQDGTQALRLLSFDLQGNVAVSTTLSASSGEGTHLQLLSTEDGRLVVLWDEPAPPADAGALPDFNRVLRVERLSCF